MSVTFVIYRHYEQVSLYHGGWNSWSGMMQYTSVNHACQTNGGGAYYTSDIVSRFY